MFICNDICSQLGLLLSYLPTHLCACCSSFADTHTLSLSPARRHMRVEKGLYASEAMAVVSLKKKNQVHQSRPGIHKKGEGEKHACSFSDARTYDTVVCHVIVCGNHQASCYAY